MRVARENPTWGYTRLRGALKNLGHELGRNTIKRILAEHGIAPAPERGRSMSWNRVRFFGGDEGDDAAGYDFCVKTPQAEWLYEVKSSLEDTCEFELTPNEMRIAASVSRRSRRRYRILYVPFVFSPDRWLVLELPNPMGDETRGRFKQVGHGSVRFRFEHGIKHTTS